MFVELSVAGGIAYLYNRFVLNHKYYKYKNLIKELSENNSSFCNSNKNTIKFINYIDLEPIDRIIINISKIIGYEEFEKKKDYLISYFSCKDIKIKKLKNANVQLDLIFDSIQVGNYEVVKQLDYEVFVGYDEQGRALLINMNRFPHMVVGGQTGTGKSRFLMQLLTNLISNCKDVDLYLFQIRKSDLIAFKNCKQTKAIVRNLEDARDTLKFLNNISIKRDLEIEKLINKNILNIEDYNKYSKFNKMNYIYVVLDEFSFFNVDAADTKYIKSLKKEILTYIKHLAVASRSSGIFLITSLQKPVNSSLPADIKSQLVTRVSFRMGDDAESIVVLGNANATKISEQECIVRTNNETLCKTANINIKIINNIIKDHIVKNKKYVDVKKYIKNSDIENNAKCKEKDTGIITEDIFKDAFR